MVNEDTDGRGKIDVRGIGGLIKGEKG